ncbi:MAG: poly(R)-hydroxyalkanoic acid synthase subunit PhaE [Euryarchaeota archaeon]|nr:poly(R)-hydroxyalkanoic acid synthase subunit PhaE [Euryarchaeota archaeon]
MENSNTESSFKSTEEFFDFWLKTYQNTLGRVVEMPAMGPTREIFQKQMKGFSAFVNLNTVWMKSNTDFMIVYMDAMRKVREKTESEMIDGNISPGQYKDFYKIWMDISSETFHEFLKSDHFSKDLGEFMSRFIDFQKINREMLEETYLKPMNLPTKTDIDEIEKELYSLQKTVKELSSQVKELSMKK